MTVEKIKSVSRGGSEKSSTGGISLSLLKKTLILGSLYDSSFAFPIRNNPKIRSRKKTYFALFKDYVSSILTFFLKLEKNLRFFIYIALLPNLITKTLPKNVLKTNLTQKLKKN